MIDELVANDADLHVRIVDTPAELRNSQVIEEDSPMYNPDLRDGDLPTIRRIRSWGGSLRRLF